MRAAPIVVAIVVAVASTSVAIWAFKRSPPPAQAAPVAEEVGPEIASSGPYPTVTVDQHQHNFGVMEAYQKQEHTFVVRNVGEAPLKLVKGKTTCTCTLSDLAKKEIMPGESADVHVSWEPKTPTEYFRQTANILTNDPKNNPIQLLVYGVVKERLLLAPTMQWPIDQVYDDKDAEYTGRIYSPILDNFKILSLTSPNPLLSATATPLTAEELEDLKESKAKTGYAIHVSLKPGVPVGRFEIPLAIETDMRALEQDGSLGKPITKTIPVTGSRKGPIQILGPNWIEEQSTVGFGNFNALKGKKVTLNLFATGAPPEGFKILKIETIPPELKVSMEPDPRMKGKSKRYLLTFEFLPGAPIGDDDTLGSVKLHTNHPHSATMEFRVRYRSF